MKGLDDGPDGLNDAAFDRALGIKAKRKVSALTADTVTDEEVRALLEEQAATTPVGPYWSTCVDAISDEWHDDDGSRAIAHNASRASARARVAEIINARKAVR